MLRREVGLGSSVLATLVIALGFNPVRVRLQRAVDRAIYGDRADPARVLSRMGERLQRPVRSPTRCWPSSPTRCGCPTSRCAADDGALAAYGTAPAVTEAIPLRYRGEDVGELVVGVRARRARARPRGSGRAGAVGGTARGRRARDGPRRTAVQRSREQIVGAREEERRRLRRDLHDGLGPVLTGIAFRADAAGNVLLERSGPGCSAAAGAARRRPAEAIEDVRRLVYDLRPPALDELGLVGALRTAREQLDGGRPVGRRARAGAAAAAARRGRGGRVPDRRGGAHQRRAPRGREPRGRARLAADALRKACPRRHRRRARRPRAGSQASGLPRCGSAIAELGGTVTAGPAGRGGRVSARLPL